MQHLFGVAGAALDQVFAVVEHDQHAAVAEEIEQRIDQGTAGLLVNIERCGYRSGHQRWFGDRGQFDEANAIGVLGLNGIGHFQCQASLAHAASTHQRQQVGVCQPFDHLRQVRFPPDQRRLVPGQVVARPGTRACLVACERFRAWRRCVCVFEHQREPVAAPRHGDHRCCAKQLAQCRDVLSKVVLIDDQAWPHEFEQFVVAHHTVVLLDQHLQQVERTRANVHWLAVGQQLALQRSKLESSKANLGCR